MSDSATRWTVAHQVPLFMGFSRQEYWSGLPYPSPGDLPYPGIEPAFPASVGRFLTTGPSEPQTLNGIFKASPQTFLGPHKHLWRKYSPPKNPGTSASFWANSGSGIVKSSLPFNQNVICSPLPCGKSRRAGESQSRRGCLSSVVSQQTTQVILAGFLRITSVAQTTTRQELPQ